MNPQTPDLFCLVRTREIASLHSLHSPSDLQRIDFKPIPPNPLKTPTIPQISLPSLASR